MLWLSLACSAENIEKQNVKEEVFVEEKTTKQEVVEIPKKTKKHVAKLYFTHFENYQKGKDPFVVAEERAFSELSPQILIDALYQGAEKEGLVVTKCQSTGAKVISLEEGILSIQLEGGCGGCGSHSIYELLEPTLLQLPNVSVLHVADPAGNFMMDSPRANSRPGCLEP